MENYWDKIDQSIRENAGEGCFWTLHLVDNTMPSTSEFKQPQSKNFQEGNIDDSLAKLKRCIEALAPAGKKYIVVALRNKTNDGAPIFLPFVNPYRKKSPARSSIGSLGNNDMFHLYLQQLQQNQDLQMQLVEERNKQRMRALARRLKEQQEPRIEGIGDKLMGLLDHPTLAPIVQGMAMKVLGINALPANNDEEGNNEGGESQAESLENSVETIEKSIGDEVDTLDFLKVIATFTKSNPAQAKALYAQFKSASK